MMLLIYRFIFLLSAVSRNITTAQHSRLGNKDFKTSVRSFGTMLSVLLVLSVKRADEMYDAMLASAGKKELLIVPGNYGKHFVEQNLLREPDLVCSNFVGKTIDMAVNMGFQNILFVAHIGKFIKVAGGIMISV